jgi:hypothetical protein
MVMGAVMVLIEGRNGKVPKDRSWAKVKAMMAKMDKFLDSLVNYEKENIHPNILKAIEDYLSNPEFDPDIVRSNRQQQRFSALESSTLCAFTKFFVTRPPSRWFWRTPTAS